MDDAEKRRTALPSQRVESRPEDVEAWIEEDLYEGLESYVDELERSGDDNYEFEARTASGSYATFSYELGEYEKGTELNVEISGGELAVDTVLNAFNELWASSDLGQKWFQA